MEAVEDVDIVVEKAAKIDESMFWRPTLRAETMDRSGKRRNVSFLGLPRMRDR